MRQIFEILPELSPFQLGLLWRISNEAIFHEWTLKEAFKAQGDMRIPPIHDYENEFYFPESKAELLDLATICGRMLWGTAQKSLKQPEKLPILTRIVASGLMGLIITFSLVGVICTGSAIYRYSQSLSRPVQ
ncbi:MAG: hypothetical protein KME30_29935 [Iphinoe sp. HA4291-MV1]|jgi:hypothetical protein|nr:hypothetical protein [Iphinoe sp. HA4291-MV1]